MKDIDEFMDRVVKALNPGMLSGKEIAECKLDMAMCRMQEIEAKHHQILHWIEAYPLKVFPEPDFAKVAKVLKDNNMTLDAVSASNMRHVLDGIKRIIEG